MTDKNSKNRYGTVSLSLYEREPHEKKFSLVDRVTVDGKVWICESDVGYELEDGSFLKFEEGDEEYCPPRKEKDHITALRQAIDYFMIHIEHASTNTEYNIVIKGKVKI